MYDSPARDLLARDVLLDAPTSGLRRLSGGQGTPHRQAWLETRLRLEASGRRHTVLGPRPRRHLLDRCVPALRGALRLAALNGRGERNARALEVERFEVAVAGLPPAFDGYRILHLSDPHFEYMPGLARQAAALLAGETLDLVALTGDYQGRPQADPGPAAEALGGLLSGLAVADGCLAVLGNHDGAGLVEPLEALGVLVLANEHAAVSRAGERLVVTGTDDPAYFFTEAAEAALRHAPAGPRLALAHTPELAAAAAAAGHALYLCGHTHGGQICLPGGRPLITQLTVGRHRARGWWRHGGMVGHTSRGLGSSALPVRFNCPPAVSILSLRPAAAQ